MPERRGTYLATFLSRLLKLQHFADVGGNTEIGACIAWSGSAVDDGQVVAAEIVDETGGGVYCQARAGDDEQIGVGDGLYRSGHRGIV